MKIRYIVICIIAGITLSLVIACNRGAGKGGPDKIQQGDDQPIVVVGGSLTMEATSGTWEDAGSGDLEHHEAGGLSNRVVSTIDISYFNINGHPVSVVMDIQKKVVIINMTYGQPGNAVLDHAVHLKTHPKGTSLILHAEGDLRLVVDQPNHKKVTIEPSRQLKVITINGSDFTLGPGKCTMTVHFVQ